MECPLASFYFIDTPSPRRSFIHEKNKNKRRSIEALVLTAWRHVMA